MKKSYSLMLALILLLSCFMLSACVNAKNYRGIIVEAECKRGVFCEVEGFDQKLLQVTFELTTDNSFYCNKDLLFVALDKKDQELNRQYCKFDDSKKMEVTFNEQSDVLSLGEGILTAALQTRTIKLYDGEEVVGSVEFREIRFKGGIIFRIKDYIE